MYVGTSFKLRVTLLDLGLAYWDSVGLFLQMLLQSELLYSLFKTCILTKLWSTRPNWWWLHVLRLMQGGQPLFKSRVLLWLKSAAHCTHIECMRTSWDFNWMVGGFRPSRGTQPRAILGMLRCKHRQTRSHSSVTQTLFACWHFSLEKLLARAPSETASILLSVVLW